MSESTRIYFDPETVAFLRDVLDGAWSSLSSKEQAFATRSLLAERILKAAAAGERDRGRLIDAALCEKEIVAFN